MMSTLALLGSLLLSAFTVSFLLLEIISPRTGRKG